MREIRKDEYSVLKVIMTVSVVAAHVARMYSFDGGAIAMPVNRLLDFIMVFIYEFHMPVFVFVSGAVFSR